MKDFSYFDLDKNRLDEEWVSHVRLYREHADRLNEARAELERQKANLELVRAEVAKKVRDNPGLYGIDGRVTEGITENTITLQPEYRKALDKLNEAKHAVGVCQVAVDTMDHRKKALENLVSLRLADYFAEPRAPKDGQQQVREMERQQVFGGKKRDKK